MSGISTIILADAGSVSSTENSANEILKVILHDFPDFFERIVKTTTQAGPIALGILLLLIVAGATYFLKGVFSTNRVMAFLGSIFLLVIGSVLLLFMYQAFQYYLSRQRAESLIFMQGALTYDSPVQDLARAGDLGVEMWAANDQVVGESRQHFYTYNDGISAKKILVTAKPDRIELTVSNRALYKLCTEDSPKLNDRNPLNATKYVVTLHNAYLASGDSGTGIEQYAINFHYFMRHGDLKYDFLAVDGFRNIDPSKVSIQTFHTPDSCIDGDPKAQYAEIFAGKSAAANTLSFFAKLAHGLGGLILTRAYSQPAPSTEKSEIVNLLGASDSSLVNKARIEISQRPSEYVESLKKLLQQRDSKFFPAQVNALTALKGASTSTLKLEKAIIDIIELSYIGPLNLRQAARSYLTDLTVVEDARKILTEKYQAEKAKAHQLTPNQYGLFLVSAREIYYAAGIKQLVSYVGEWGNRDRVPEAIEPSLRDFQAGIDLIVDVPNYIVVPFAKSYYGKAMALRAKVAVKAALSKLGANATSKQIDRQISEMVEQRAPLPFNDTERAEFLSVIDNFLRVVNEREREYLWPEHIKSLRRCREHATYDCLHME